MRRLTARASIAYAAGLAALCLARPGARVLGAGLLIALPGLGLRFWATGYLTKNRRLVREGPYRHLRHPLYLGTWLITTGFLVAGFGPEAPQPWLALLAVAFQVGFFGSYLPRKEAKEAARLERRFGDEFRRFRQAVPAFGPRLRPVPAPPDAVRWSAARVGGNSEWGTVGGTLAAFGFLGARCAGWLP